MEPGAVEFIKQPFALVQVGDFIDAISPLFEFL
jgi:hypothetical protein